MRKILLFIICFWISISLNARQFKLSSPDGNLVTNVSVKDKIEYDIWYKGKNILEPSFLSMKLKDGQTWGIQPRLRAVRTRFIDNSYKSPIYKRSQVQDIYNELELEFRGDYRIIFRVYDDGVAYRFATSCSEPFTVKDEEAIFNFPEESKAYVSYVRENGYHADNMTNEGTFEEQFFKSFVNTYEQIYLKEWQNKRLAFMPLLVDVNGVKICLTEADLLNYPGMYLNIPDGSESLEGVFAPYPKDLKQGGSEMLQEVVLSRENYIAKCEPGAKFPWRTLIVVDKEYKLLDNDMVYRLSTPCMLSDISWIKPGKSAWEWWNNAGLYGVDFKAGMNDETYKYYIDFAYENGLEYVLIDAGWYENGNIMKPVETLNLSELINYANNKDIGLILWTGCYPFKQQMEEVCKYYSDLGIKGFKIDFIDRDDQAMVQFHYKAAEIAAKYRLVLDFHGTYKPTGLQRTFPNVLTFEAVQGLEHMKWASPRVDQVTYDVIMPYIRMVAGPLDYTQGSMRNASRKNYKPVYAEPMSQGTRVRQMAEYVLFESPLSMLCDSPCNYAKEPECTNFITRIPTVWDDSKALDGKISEYAVIARKKDDVWYVGGINNWTPRVIDVDLSFLGKGAFLAEIFKDGINAGEIARDFKKEQIEIYSGQKLSIRMESGGGFVIKITPQKENNQ